MSENTRHVGPPRLLDFTCLVKEPDSGTSACHLSLKLENKQTQAVGPSEKEQSTSITMELEPATLNTLLDGLTRIRDQLSTVANRK